MDSDILFWSLCVSNLEIILEAGSCWTEVNQFTRPTFNCWEILRCYQAGTHSAIPSILYQSVLIKKLWKDVGGLEKLKCVWGFTWSTTRLKSYYYQNRVVQEYSWKITRIKLKLHQDKVILWDLRHKKIHFTTVVNWGMLSILWSYTVMVLQIRKYLMY